MTSEKGDLRTLAIPEQESQALYANIACVALQFTFIESLFIDIAPFVSQQMGSFYNSIPDRQLPHKCIYEVLLYANIYLCRQTRKCHSALAAAEQMRRVVSRREDAETESKAGELVPRALYLL